MLPGPTFLQSVFPSHGPTLQQSLLPELHLWTVFPKPTLLLSVPIVYISTISVPRAAISTKQSHIVEWFRCIHPLSSEFVPINLSMTVSASSWTAGDDAVSSSFVNRCGSWLLCTVQRNDWSARGQTRQVSHTNGISRLPGTLCSYPGTKCLVSLQDSCKTTFS
jgi:hypothetical protein